MIYTACLALGLLFTIISAVAGHFSHEVGLGQVEDEPAATHVGRGQPDDVAQIHDTLGSQPRRTSSRKTSISRLGSRSCTRMLVPVFALSASGGRSHPVAVRKGAGLRLYQPIDPLVSLEDVLVAPARAVVCR